MTNVSAHCLRWMCADAEKAWVICSVLQDLRKEQFSDPDLSAVATSMLNQMFGTQPEGLEFNDCRHRAALAAQNVIWRSAGALGAVCKHFPEGVPA